MEKAVRMLGIILPSRWTVFGRALRTRITLHRRMGASVGETWQYGLSTAR